MRSLSSLLLAPFVAISIFAAAASAQTTFNVVLLGSNEVPPSGSPATGSGTVTLNAAQNQLSYNITFSGLLAPETASHIHMAAAGVNGPVIIPIPNGSPKIGTSPIAAAQVAAMLANGLYVNVHSTAFPGGEIRGQIMLVARQEAEPNDSKTAANAMLSLAAGEVIIGTTTGVATNGAVDSIDYFLIDSPLSTRGIYRHILNVGSTTPGQPVSIRGLLQVSGVITLGSNPQLQVGRTDANNNREIMWYDFGNSGRIYASVSGTATTTARYLARHDVVTVTPIAIGPFVEGDIQFGEVGANVMDFEYWLYDTEFQPIPGYGRDDIDSPGMTRPFQPGVYFIAVSRFNFANNLPAAADDAFRDGNVLDFPGVAADSVNGTPVAANMGVTNIGTTINVPVNLAGPFDVAWYRFVVTPDCDADFNHDGSVDFFDYLDFVDAFSIGC